MNKITTCVFPVAGYGTRFLPVTKAIPKEMLPIVNKPLIDYAVNEAKSGGLNNMVMVTSKFKPSLENYFRKNITLEKFLRGSSKESLLDDINYLISNCSFKFVNQERMLGLGNAISYAEKYINQEAFAVILPDDLCLTKNNDSVISQMIKISEQFPGYSIVAIEEVDFQDVNKYGIISGKSFHNQDRLILVDDMIEKPRAEDSPSNLAIIGRYILSKDIFDYIRKSEVTIGGEIQITSALAELAKRKKVLAYKFKGERIDCGTTDGFVRANTEIYSRTLSQINP